MIARLLRWWHWPDDDRVETWGGDRPPDHWLPVGVVTDVEWTED